MKSAPGMTKDTYLEMKLHEILVESPGIDLLEMGRPEGPGCYCYANNILRRHLDVLAHNYPFVVMDNEAGMEHLSRRTTQGVDHLFFLSDYSFKGIRTVGKIRDLIAELKLSVKKSTWSWTGPRKSLTRFFGGDPGAGGGFWGPSRPTFILSLT